MLNIGSQLCIKMCMIIANLVMHVESAIEKLQRITKEKEAQKNKHKLRQEEEVELLRKKQTK